jgi:O-methyltransferase
LRGYECDTSLEALRCLVPRAIIHKGWFPESADGLENLRFAFAMIDVDKYQSTKAALEWFYPRVNPVRLYFHDYNSLESEYTASDATKKFLQDSIERLFEIPDRAGSVVFRKVP